MKSLFWSIRGFGARGRQDQICHLVHDANVCLVCLIETFKASFSNNELSSTAGADHFVWRCLPAFWHSGSILIGAKLDCFDFVAFDHGIFWASMVVLHKSLNVLWVVLVVYGPVGHSLSTLFLDELTAKIDSCNLPLLIGGDFNLPRSPDDKNNSNFSWLLADAFNDFIADYALREIPRTGARFTWSNHQSNPVQSVLDHVFTSPLWDTLFQRTSLATLPHVGSDHSPLLLDLGVISASMTLRFQFDVSWLMVEGFCDLISGKIASLLASRVRSFGPMDDWHFCAY